MALKHAAGGRGSGFSEVAARFMGSPRTKRAGARRPKASAEIDPPFMRATYPDLADLSDDAIAEHYESFGRTEGRIAAPHASRTHLLDLVRREASVLEIGPYFSPVVRGENVRYFDVLSREQMSERAKALYGEVGDRIPEIDWVSPEADLSIVDETFDAAVSSHCIEHQPDLVRHLRDVAAVLSPGGRYYLMIPDKRYCFDQTICASHVGDVLEAHVEKRRVHTLANVIEHYALTTHNDSTRHWAGDHVFEDATNPPLERLRSALKSYADADGAYLDVHAWQFTPETFRAIIGDLHALDLSPLEVERVYESPLNSVEFTAILRKAA